MKRTVHSGREAAHIKPAHQCQRIYHAVTEFLGLMHFRNRLARSPYRTSRSTSSSVAGLRRKATMSTPSIASPPPMPMRISK